MIIAYVDEAGDDGFPKYSSPVFVLSQISTHYQNWQRIHGEIVEFRRQLKANYNFPIKLEIHTSYLLKNKKPYNLLGIPDNVRLNIINDYVKFISGLDIQIINVAINKTIIKNPSYRILEHAFQYSIQRLENYLIEADPSNKFLVIVDEGRVEKMRAVARKIQRVNYIPSKINPGQTYRREIKRMIEDPLPKESNQSGFIQIVDLVSFVVYYYIGIKHGLFGLPSRLPCQLVQSVIIQWLEELKPILNLKASESDPFGIVCYPQSP